jgi:hypothetical protein
MGGAFMVEKASEGKGVPPEGEPNEILSSEIRKSKQDKDPFPKIESSPILLPETGKPKQDKDPFPEGEPIILPSEVREAEPHTRRPGLQIPFNARSQMRGYKESVHEAPIAARETSEVRRLQAEVLQLREKLERKEAEVRLLQEWLDVRGSVKSPNRLEAASRDGVRSPPHT